MSSSASNADSPARLTPTAPFRWEYFPGFGSVVPLVLAAGALGAAVHWQTKNDYLAALAGGLVLAAGWRALVPAQYEVGPGGLHVTTLWRRKRISWRDIDRIELGSRGMFLLPARSRWGRWRGLYVPLGSNPAEVAHAVRHYCQRSATTLDSAIAGRSASGS